MSPTESAYALLFASGLLGGFGHCTAMCGPIAAALSLCLHGDRRIAPHLLYNLGRIATYSLIGGAAGMAGSFLGIATGLGPVQKWVAIGTGLLVVLMGLAVGGWLPRLPSLAGTNGPSGRLLRLARFVRESGGHGVFFPLGLVLGFLPCGLVYAALLAAARAGMETQDPAGGFLRGFLAMALFGIGTVPSLLLVGKAVNLLGARMRRGLYRASSALVVVAGLVYIARAFRG